MADSSKPPSEWVPTDEAMKLAGFVNNDSFIREIRRRGIEARRGGRNKKFYPRHRMEEIARDRRAAEARRNPQPQRDPLKDPISSGELQAKIVKLFKAKTPLYDIVVQLEVPMHVVKALFKEWWELGQMSQDWLEPGATPRQPPPAPPPSPLDAAAAILTSPTAPAAASATVPAAATVGAEPDHTPTPDGMCCHKHFLAKRRAG